MKRFSFATIGLTAILLASCNKSAVTLNYTLKIDAPNAQRAMELLSATEHTLERRTMALGKMAIVSATPDGEKAGKLSITLTDPTQEERVKEILMEPFVVEFKTAKPETALKPTEEGAEWSATGLTGEHLVWVQPVKEKTTGSVGAELIFDETGRQMLEKIFVENKGMELGVFVRGLLVSQVSIDGTPLQDRMILDGIPTESLAAVFSDDVNVGLHVTFIPN